MMIEREAKRVIESSVVGFAFAGRHIRSTAHSVKTRRQRCVTVFILFYYYFLNMNVAGGFNSSGDTGR